MIIRISIQSEMEQKSTWRQKVDGQLPIMHSRLRIQWCCPPCQLAISACVCTLQENLSSLNIVLGSFVGNWRTRGLPIRGLVNSRTGQVAVSQMPPRERKLSTQSRRWHSRVVQSASWPVREMSSPRVGVSASCPVTVLCDCLRMWTCTHDCTSVGRACIWRTHDSRSAGIIRLQLSENEMIHHVLFINVRRWVIAVVFSSWVIANCVHL